MLSSIPLTLQVFAGIMLNSEKQRVLITAGASGIGKAMAMALEASGSLVWVVDTDEEALGKCPQSWQCDCVDVTNETGIESLFSHIENTRGGYLHQFNSWHPRLFPSRAVCGGKVGSPRSYENSCHRGRPIWHKI